ncbi:MAG: hypothetical protein FJ011_27340, partial [Chloroflexi bacterium]|nr:hypothetical protein [Chloroflexota bacterium]
MFKRFFAALCVALLGSFVCGDVTSAVEPMPLYVIGTAQLDGGYVPDGTTIQAYCAGYLAGQTTTFTYNGAACFAFDVEGDDPDTETRDGCRPGE